MQSIFLATQAILREFFRWRLRQMGTYVPSLVKSREVKLEDTKKVGYGLFPLRQPFSQLQNFPQGEKAVTTSFRTSIPRVPQTL